MKISKRKSHKFVTFLFYYICTGYTDTCLPVLPTLSYLTTPESIDLHKFFYEMRESNFKYAIMEVSSQSYKRDRLYGVEFEYGVFTNIAEDHISRN